MVWDIFGIYDWDIFGRYNGCNWDVTETSLLSCFARCFPCCSQAVLSHPLKAPAASPRNPGPRTRAAPSQTPLDRRSSKRRRGRGRRRRRRRGRGRRRASRGRRGRGRRRASRRRRSKSTSLRRLPPRTPRTLSQLFTIENLKASPRAPPA